MKWKLELDALIESTMAFAKDIKRGQPIADLPVAKRTAEQALADTSTPIPPPTTIAPTVVLPASQRDEIRQRVSSFKTHQEKIAGTRGILFASESKHAGARRSVRLSFRNQSSRAL
jgi:hypothetical protein